MTTMIAEVYDALREAGASEGKSRAAAEKRSAYEYRFNRRFDALEARFDTLEARLDFRFAELESRFDKKLADLEGRFDKRFIALEARVTFLQWQFGLLMAGVASLIIKAFFGGY
jgi:hypothetical protein